MLPVALERIEKLGHRVFEAGDYNLNLFGIRAAERQAGAFDDALGCAYKVGGQWRVHYWQGTTDPGWLYLDGASERFGVDGTAILCPGQYLGAYTIGPHGRTRYDALIQSDDVAVFRDANRDHILDTAPETITHGRFGINIHAAAVNPYDETSEAPGSVGPWSAGCQVLLAPGFRDMMTLCKRQLEAHPTWVRFSYTLLDQWW